MESILKWSDNVRLLKLDSINVWAYEHKFINNSHLFFNLFKLRVFKNADKWSKPRMEAAQGKVIYGQSGEQSREFIIIIYLFIFIQRLFKQYSIIYHSLWIFYMKTLYHLQIHSDGIWSYEEQINTPVLPASHPDYGTCRSADWDRPLSKNVRKTFTARHCQLYHQENQKTKCSILASFYQCQLCCFGCFQRFCIAF